MAHAMLEERGMRILQLASSFTPGDVPRHVLDLTAWLRARGHHVALAGARGPWLDEARDRDFHHVRLDRLTMESGAGALRKTAAMSCAMRLRNVLSAGAFDLVHAHQSALVPIAKLARIGLNLPIALTVHHIELSASSPLSPKAVHAADHLFASSLHAARDIAERSGLAVGAIEIAGLGIYPARTLDHNAVARLRHRLLGGGHALIVTVARAKNEDALVPLFEIASCVRKTAPHARFVVITDPSLRDVGQTAADKAGLSDILTFCRGAESAYLHHLAAGDVFLTPPGWEARPTTIVEALRAGLPAITAEPDALSDLSGEGGGWTPARREPEGMAAAISDLAHNEAKRARLCAAALKRGASDRFDPEHVNTNLMAAYRRTVMTGRTRGARHTQTASPR